MRLEVEGDTRGRWDRERLAQVVANLVGNAIAHGKADGAIDIQLRGELEAVSLRVHNEGPAIPAPAQASIFDPFRRGPARGAARSEGLGLGLYICREMVRAHGGQIAVESSDGAGTTFSVRLPRAAKPQAAFAG